MKGAIMEEETKEREETQDRVIELVMDLPLAAIEKILIVAETLRWAEDSKDPAGSGPSDQPA